MIIFRLISMVLLLPSLLFAMTYEQPLSKLSAGASPKFMGTADDFTVKIPVSPRWTVKNMKLYISYQNSNALLEPLSGLNVQFNGYTVFQQKLSPIANSGIIETDVPTLLIEPTYNELTISVHQRTTEKCQDHKDGGLWSSVDLSRSKIIIDYDINNIPLKLSSVQSLMFDNKDLSNNEINIAIEKYTPENIRMAAIAASGVALKKGYVKIKYHVSENVIHGMDNIVIGSRSFVKNLGFTGEIRDVTIAYLPQENGITDETHAALIFSGDQTMKLENILKAFSLTTVPYPEAGGMNVRSITVPDKAAYSKYAVLNEKKRYRLSDLGMSDVTLQGMDLKKTSFNFYLPDDSYIASNEFMTIFFHVVYGSDMGKGSSMNVFLNGRFAGSIPLSTKHGGRYDKYQMIIPARLVHGGKNTVDMQASMALTSSNECSALFDDNLQLTILSDSYIETPHISQWIKMPDLRVMMASGFPFTATSGMQGTEIVIGGMSKQYAESVVNLLAYYTRQNMTLPFDVTVSASGHEGKAKNKIYLLQTSMANKIFAGSTPLTTTEFKLSDQFKDKAQKTSFIERLLEASNEHWQELSPSYGMIRMDAGQQTGADKVIIYEMQSDKTSDGTYAVISSDSPESLLNGIDAITSEKVSPQISGALSLVDFSDINHPTVYFSDSGDKYYLGSLRMNIGVMDLIAHFPKTSLAVMAVIFLIMVFALYRTLRFYRRRRILSGK